jgi:hypothetical protein
MRQSKIFDVHQLQHRLRRRSCHKKTDRARPKIVRIEHEQQLMQEGELMQSIADHGRNHGSIREGRAKKLTLICVCLLSWPPRSSTAWTNRAWSAVVHRIRGARALRFNPGTGALAAARLNAYPCWGGRWLRRPASSSPRAGVRSSRLRPGESALRLGFAKNPISPLPSSSSYVASGFATVDASEDTAGRLIWRERFGRFLRSIGRDQAKECHRLAATSTIKWAERTEATGQSTSYFSESTDRTLLDELSQGHHGRDGRSYIIGGPVIKENRKEASRKREERR